MPKIAYIDQKQYLKARTKSTLATCNTILEDYAQQGFDLTLRQLYYQLVSRGFIANNDREYRNLGAIVNDGRLTGFVDWDHIIDRTRGTRGRSTWESPQSIVRATAHSYHLDHWEGQRFRPEVWVEKDALVGVVGQAASQYDAPYLSCRGYTSQSEMWRASLRFKSYLRGGQIPVVIHLGDHDPSGIDMSRDIEERLAMFGAEVDFRRIALNMDQIEKYDPPPNPAKLSDARAQSYVEKFGHESWELDALPPQVLSKLITDELQSLIDPGPWEFVEMREQRDKRLLEGMTKHWERISWYVERKLRAA